MKRTIRLISSMSRSRYLKRYNRCSVDDEQIKMLLDMSFELTGVKIKKRRKGDADDDQTRDDG